MAALGPFKIVILGEGRVGKTSLLRRYKYNQFDEHEASTLNATYLEKTAEDKKSGKEVKLALWDTAGQERFHSLAPIYYRDADGALIVYDITEPDTFKRVSTWVNELKTNGCSIPVSIVGNKYDMKTQQRVATSEAEDFARSIGARHSHASAKHARGVEEAFAALIEGVLDHKSQAPAVSQRGSRRSRPNIAEQAPVPPAPWTSAGGGQPQQPVQRPSQSLQYPPAHQPTARTSSGEQPAPAPTAAPAATPAATPAAAPAAKPAAKPRTSLFDDDDDEPLVGGGGSGAPRGRASGAAPLPSPAEAAAAAFPAPVAPAPAPLPPPAAPRERGFKLESPAPKRGQVPAGGSFSSGRDAPRKKEGCC